MESHYLILYIVALFFGAAGAWVVGNYGFKLGLIDRPNKRSSHSDPTPKGGGTGILIGFLVVALSLKLPAGFWGPVALIFPVFGRFNLPGEFVAEQPMANTGRPIHYTSFGFCCRHG